MRRWCRASKRYDCHRVRICDSHTSCRVTLLLRYLRFLDDQSSFWDNFEKLHAQEVVKHAHANGSLSTRPGLVYVLLSYFHLFTDLDALHLLAESPPKAVFHSWPVSHVSPGVGVLMMHEKEALRSWARAQAAICVSKPMSADLITPTHRKLLVTVAFGPPGRLTNDQLHSKECKHLILPHFKTFPFTSDLVCLWRTFYTTLLWLPEECTAKRSSKSEDIRRLIYSHLSDDGPRKLRSFSLHMSYSFGSHQILVPSLSVSWCCCRGLVKSAGRVPTPNIHCRFSISSKTTLPS